MDILAGIWPILAMASLAMLAFPEKIWRQGHMKKRSKKIEDRGI